MRVYELAKKYGWKSKEAVEALRKAGISVSTHMSSLKGDALDEAIGVLSGKKPRSGTAGRGGNAGSEATVANVGSDGRGTGGGKRIRKSAGMERSRGAGEGGKSGVGSNQQGRTSLGGSGHSARNGRPGGVASGTSSPKVVGHVEIKATKTERESKQTGAKSKGASVEKREESSGGRRVSHAQHGNAERRVRLSSAAKKRKKREQRREELRRVQQEEEELYGGGVESIEVSGPMPVYELARKIKRRLTEVVLELLLEGHAYARNDVLPVDLIKLACSKFGVAVIDESRRLHLEEEPSVDEEKLIGLRLEQEVEEQKKSEPRWPVVVVMGHVDHGKTTLLDYVREQNVAAKEKGGITQHISAYEVDTRFGRLVFIDTPGHEAFSFMRERGTVVTDIVILVVAADDGVMPQTVEAIEHAKVAGVPIVVAVNKIDLVKNRTEAIERVSRDISQHGLVPEAWGGDVVVAPISAKTGEGVEELLEMVSLQAEMLELRADRTAKARAFVIESQIEKGFGNVATVICKNGSLHVGDYFVCGMTAGKVRVLISSDGKRIKEAGPSVPVKVVGFESNVEVGDLLEVVSKDEYRRRKERAERSVRSGSGLRMMKATVGEHDVALIVKADTRGTLEAVIGLIRKLNKRMEKTGSKAVVIGSGLGTVSESDVLAAKDAEAMVLGMHVGMDRTALGAASSLGVEVKNFDIIYRLEEFVRDLILSKEVRVPVREKSAVANVLKTFRVKGIGVVAGCVVESGIIRKGMVGVCKRKGKVVGEGKIVSLQRERKPAQEVISGQECGFLTEGFNGWMVGDRVEIFEEQLVRRSEALKTGKYKK